MTRLASQQVAGYFPSPAHLLPSFASILRWPDQLDHAVLLDPCAGDGAAIAELRRLWHAGLPPAPRRLDWRSTTRLTILASELERDRALALRGNLDQAGDVAYHADAFRLYPTVPATTGATLLYLNPPYDHDPECKRLEHRFLLRFTQHLHPGSGILFYLVPDHVLAVSADFLARHYLDLRAWRLPDPDYACFRQVLLVGRRARRPLFENGFADEIRRWGERPETLPVLPERVLDPLSVEPEPDPPYLLGFTVHADDMSSALQAFRLWTADAGGKAPSTRELLGARYETAVPPKPAHIALALSSGLFNGHRLEPNDPRRDPPILAKGTFLRRWVELDEKTDEHGEVTAVVEIEQPHLELAILRLDDYTFHTLASGTIPTGERDPSLWNAADLISRYDRSLVELLGRQFPAIHDPTRGDQQIALPVLARRPFRVQAEAVQAALKLLARRRNPFLVAEVGTGKSTVALTIAAALSPAWRSQTATELRRLGFPDDLPVVRKALILCPPLCGAAHNGGRTTC